MWEPRRLTTLWAYTACYRDNFTFTFTYVELRMWLCWGGEESIRTFFSVKLLGERSYVDRKGKRKVTFGYDLGR
jgi:hypothetical protein